MSKRRERPAVYLTHETINSGSELRLDKTVGVGRLELGADIERLGEVADEFRDMAQDNVPDRIGVSAIMTEPEFVRIMDKIRRAKTPMVLRLVWSNGFVFKREWLVQGVTPPIGSDDVQIAEVDLLHRRREKIGY